jgi:hypothetical protein
MTDKQTLSESRIEEISPHRRHPRMLLSGDPAVVLALLQLSHPQMPRFRLKSITGMT